MTTLWDYFFGEDEAAEPPAAETPSPAPDTTAPDTTPETPPEAAPTRPGDVPDAGRDVEEIVEPCTRFQGQVTEITDIANAVAVTVGGAAVSAPYWTLGPPNYQDGMQSTHPAAVPTEGGSDLEMTIKVDVTSADGLSGTADLVGTLTDGSTIELKGTFPVSVGVHSVTVKMDTAPTVLARHMGDIVWEAVVPGCGTHMIGRTRVEIYRIIRDHPAPFVAAGRPAEGLRFIYQNMSVGGVDVATAIAASDITVTANITTYLHNGHGMTYDTTRGAFAFLSGANESNFKMNDYIAKRPAAIVNCYDQAAAVLVFSGIMGVAGKKRYVDPYGFINTTTLVGGTRCNNPFYNNAAYTTRAVVDRLDTGRSSFGNHEFFVAVASSKVFDACAGPALGTDDYLGYMAASVDTAMRSAGVEIPNGLAYWGARWVATDDYGGGTTTIS